MKTIPLTAIQLTSLTVAVDSGIEATDLLTSSSVQEDIDNGISTLNLLQEIKVILEHLAFQETDTFELELPDEWAGPLSYEVDCLLDQQRELLDEEDADIDELEARIEALEYLTNTICP